MGLNPRVPVKMSEIRSPEGVFFFGKTAVIFYHVMSFFSF